MTQVITHNVTSSNGVDIFPYGLKFANGTALSIQDSIKFLQANNSLYYKDNILPIINTSSLVFGNSSVDLFSIIIPTLTLGGQTFNGTVGAGVVNTQFFTANGTWTNPNNALGLTGNEQVFIMMWGGGGGGNTNLGGGGGACHISTFLISEVGNTATITVGSAGAVGVAGGNSVFAPTGTALTRSAYGGGTANTGTSGQSGGGGGLLGPGILGTGGEPLGGAFIVGGGGDSTYGGGGGTSQTTVLAGGGSSIFGGGASGGAKGGAPGNSIYGGGGGCNNFSGVSTTTFGGPGGNSTISSAIPGGGGGANGHSGARGEVRVWVIK